MTRPSEPIEQFLAARTVEDGDCMRWMGYCYNGHPGMTRDGKKMLVRRFLWERANGPIPPGKFLRCTCSTPRCINLEHVEPMTMRQITKIEGAAGKMSGPARSAKIAAVKRAGKQARITQDDARAIRHSDDSSTILSAAYGLSVSTVCRIKRGEVRKDFGANPFAGLGA